VSSTPIADNDAAARLDAILTEWSGEWLATGSLAALEGDPAPSSGPPRWLLRLRGDEKEFVTLWLTLRQRTVHVEVQLMPAPEESVADVFRFLLTKNADLHELHVALGPENAVYLVGRVPVGEISSVRLDEICGAALHYVDEIYPTAVAMGLPSMSRRRRRTSSS
jgi:hypothetical protein